MIAGVPRSSEAFVIPSNGTVAFVSDAPITSSPITTAGQTFDRTQQETQVASTTPEQEAVTATTIAAVIADRQASDREPLADVRAGVTAAVTVEPARVLVVNGADEAGLAGRTARDLAAKGYTDTDTTDALQRAERTTVFYAPGFDDEAAVLAEAMGLWAPLEPMPATAITVNGAEVDADLVLLLGPTS